MTSQLRLQLSVGILHAGGVLACPTEAVWGLSADPFDEGAVQRILALKRRPVAKGLILVAGSMSQLGFLLQGLSDAKLKKLQASWPGPNTWLIPHHGRVPHWIHGEHETVAVRVSAHPTVSSLCDLWGGPLVSTSANPGGSQPPRELFQVIRYFGHRLDGIVPGATGSSPRPSLIRDLETDRVIRA